MPIIEHLYERPKIERLLICHACNSPFTSHSRNQKYCLACKELKRQSTEKNRKYKIIRNRLY